MRAPQVENSVLLHHLATNTGLVSAVQRSSRSDTDRYATGLRSGRDALAWVAQALTDRFKQVGVFAVQARTQ